VLVNNAGIYPPDGTLSTDETTFDRVFAVNVKAPFFLTAALIPAMIEAGDGRVINLGSWIAHLGIPGAAVYGSTKGTMETLARTWAAEFGAAGDPGECHLSRSRARQPRRPGRRSRGCHGPDASRAARPSGRYRRRRGASSDDHRNSASGSGSRRSTASRT
jgi:NAD(P)-dependent dehydrogenase (short-subunit alcohol dehydrogenase family)